MIQPCLIDTSEQQVADSLPALKLPVYFMVNSYKHGDYEHVFAEFKGTVLAGWEIGVPKVTVTDENGNTAELTIDEAADQAITEKQIRDFILKYKNKPLQLLKKQVLDEIAYERAIAATIIVPESHVSLINDLNASLIKRGQNASDFNFVYIDATTAHFKQMIESYDINISTDLPAELFLDFRGEPKYVVMKNVNSTDEIITKANALQQTSDAWSESMLL